MEGEGTEAVAGIEWDVELFKLRRVAGSEGHNNTFCGIAMSNKVCEPKRVS